MAVTHLVGLSAPLPLRRLWLACGGSGREDWVNNPAASKQTTQRQGQSAVCSGLHPGSQTPAERKAPPRAGLGTSTMPLARAIQDSSVFVWVVSSLGLGVGQASGCRAFHGEAPARPGSHQA